MTPKCVERASSQTRNNSRPYTRIAHPIARSTCNKILPAIWITERKFSGGIMDKIKFPYRSDGHLALLHVIPDSGAWAKHNLEVEYDYFIEAKDAHKMVASGEVEFVSGNHLTPYRSEERRVGKECR